MTDRNYTVSAPTGGGALTNMFRGGFPVGQDTGAQFDFQRQQASTAGFGQIFDIFGQIGSLFSNKSASEDYAEQVKAARDRAYDNARVIGAAKKESLIKVAEFTSQLLRDNAQTLTTNAINMRTQANAELAVNQSKVAAGLGTVKTQYATSGVQLGTGTAKDVQNRVIDYGLKGAESNYRQRINDIGKIVSQASQQRIEADFTEWQARDQARFVDAELQMRLY